MHELLERARQWSLMPYLWATMDVALLTIILLIANGSKSPLVPVYLVILMSTGFRWRPWLSTQPRSASERSCFSSWRLTPDDRNSVLP